MKYRVIKRAKGWAVQRRIGEIIPSWHTLSTHHFHWLASLHLWFLREMARK